MLLILNSSVGAGPVPGAEPPAAAVAACDGSIAPACAATFGVGFSPPEICNLFYQTTPPTIFTRRPT